MAQSREARIAVYGLNGPGLPLAVQFSKYFRTMAFDHDESRRRKIRTELTDDSPVELVDCAEKLSEANVFVIAAPTGVDEHKQPDLQYIEESTREVADLLEGGELVIFTSPLYPGATEERLIPLLEIQSGLTVGGELAVAYCPPAMTADDEEPFADITQVISGSSDEAVARIEEIYSVTFPGGVHPTTSLRVAEAACLVDNIQRDLNLALSNEIAIIGRSLELDSKKALEAAGAMGGHPPQSPGLALDERLVSHPYFLANKAIEQGYHPELIVAGRKINDSLPDYVVQRVTALMFQRRIEVGESRLLLLTNAHERSSVADRTFRQFAKKFAEFEMVVDILDPLDRIQSPTGERLTTPDELEYGTYDALVILDEVSGIPDLPPGRIRELGTPEAVLFDVSGTLPAYTVDEAL